MENKDEIIGHKGIIERFNHFLSPFDLDLQEKSKRILAGSIVIITSPVLIGFSVLHLLRDELFLGFFLLIAGVSLIFSFLILRKFENLAIFSRINLVLVGVLFLYLLVSSRPHGHMALWLYIYPLVVFFMLGHIEGLLFNLAFFICVIIFFFIQKYTLWTPIYPIEFKVRFSIALFLVGGLAYTYEFIRDKFQKGMMENQQRLEKETEKLVAAKKESEEANKTKSEFLANMSHELRTPLNHIIGFTELLLNNDDGELNSIQKEYIADVHGSGKHLLSLINDVLDLSKVESGKLNLEISDVNLKKVIENSVAIVKDIALKNQIKLSLNMDTVPKTIQSDERKLKQILYNLLSNAMKFTPNGGHVSLTAQTFKFKDEEVSIVDNSKNDSVMISISDNGIGLSPKDLERVFNPFEQVENSASRKFQGTGLGLALTKKLVHLHGGKIWGKSEGIGKGSIFSFIIPIQAKID